MVGARRRSARREVPAHARPVRRARLRRRGHGGADHRHQRQPRDRARPDRAGQGRSPRCDVLSGGRFVLGVGAGWNKQEMRNHGTDPGDAPRQHARARRGHAGDLARRRGRLPRQARGLRPDLAVAEAAAAARSAGLRRRQRPARRGPRAALRRRLDAEHAGPRDARAADRRAARAGRPRTFRSSTTARRRRTWTRCEARASTTR